MVRTALISGLLMALFTAMSTWVHPTYGWYIFLALPLVLGAGVSAYATKKHDVSVGKILATTALSNAVACVSLLLLAVEGLICLVMALPITTVGMLVGVFLGRFASRRGKAAFGSRVTIGIVPVILAVVDGSNHEPIVRTVHSSVEIPAPPHVVWQSVVAIPPLAEPTELVFRAGVAYPTHVTLRDTGVGALRICHFSTGDFVEPITIWQPPSRLAFSVQRMPETMRELSPWDIHPEHLHGYFVTTNGSFRLESLPNQTTRLTGSTTYYHSIQPEWYWRMWSEHIIASIHQRVLYHIRNHIITENHKQHSKKRLAQNERTPLSLRRDSTDQTYSNSRQQ